MDRCLCTLVVSVVWHHLPLRPSRPSDHEIGCSKDEKDDQKEYLLGKCGILARNTFSVNTEYLLGILA